MNMLLDLANITYIFSYSVRDVLLLRVLAVVAGGLLIPYYYLQATPLMAPIYWGLGFIALNMYWIVRLLLERRSVELTEEQQRLYRLAFRVLKPREMLELLELATWENIEAGQMLETEGKAQDKMGVIVSGRADVRINGRSVNVFEAGHFAGKGAFLTDDDVSAVSIVALEPIRLASWRNQDLRKFLQNNAELSAALNL
ncbi:MAG: cyclic nucleotide-binding domain-containing protein, partial [Pseudomonadota bacterium]